MLFASDEASACIRTGTREGDALEAQALCVFLSAAAKRWVAFIVSRPGDEEARTALTLGVEVAVDEVGTVIGTGFRKGDALVICARHSPSGFAGAGLEVAVCVSSTGTTDFTGFSSLEDAISAEAIGVF